MAKFTSRFPELGFYCCGELRRFSNGVYNTEDKDEIKVLESLADVHCECEDEVPVVAPAPKPKAAANKK